MKNVLAAIVISCGTAIQASNTSAPVYSLTVTSDKPNVDPGHTVKLQLHVFGNAPLKAHKFCGSIPPDLIDGGVEVRHFSVVTSNGSPVKWRYPANTNKLSASFYAHFADAYFVEYGTREDGEIPALFGEGGVWNGPPGAEKYEAPLTFVFKVAKHASAGVHSVNFKFFYSNESGSGVAEASTPIRVSSFGERKQNLLMGILAVIGIVFPLTIPTASGKGRRLVWSGLALFVVVLLWLMQV